VGIAAVDTDSTCRLAASYEAKAYGGRPAPGERCQDSAPAISIAGAAEALWNTTKNRQSSKNISIYKPSPSTKWAAS
jgi:hypothetical protein